MQIQIIKHYLNNLKAAVFEFFLQLLIENVKKVFLHVFRDTLNKVRKNVTFFFQHCRQRRTYSEKINVFTFFESRSIHKRRIRGRYTAVSHLINYCFKIFILSTFENNMTQKRSIKTFKKAILKGWPLEYDCFSPMIDQMMLSIWRIVIGFVIARMLYSFSVIQHFFRNVLN